MFKKLMQQVDRFLGRGVIDDQLFEELEEALLLSDTHIEIVHKLIEQLRLEIKNKKITDSTAIKSHLQTLMAETLQSIPTHLSKPDCKPIVYLFVGVNGAGKTTTIAKLAYKLTQEGNKVLLAAGDTFRAAAIEQLETWSQRIGTDFVRSQHGGDPAAVIFDAITAAKARNIDYVLADTAGRQQSKQDLMKELDKIIRVSEKALGEKPHEVLLVMDAHTGQNALRQAEGFLGSSGVTGIALTKLDGTAKGGALLGIHQRLNIPIKLIGVGEKVTDLQLFNPTTFAKNLFEI